MLLDIAPVLIWYLYWSAPTAVSWYKKNSSVTSFSLESITEKLVAVVGFVLLKTAPSLDVGHTKSVIAAPGATPSLKLEK